MWRLIQLWRALLRPFKEATPPPPDTKPTEPPSPIPDSWDYQINLINTSFDAIQRFFDLITLKPRDPRTGPTAEMRPTSIGLLCQVPDERTENGGSTSKCSGTLKKERVLRGERIIVEQDLRLISQGRVTFCDIECSTIPGSPGLRVQLEVSPAFSGILVNRDKLRWTATVPIEPLVSRGDYPLELQKDYRLRVEVVPADVNGVIKVAINGKIVIHEILPTITTKIPYYDRVETLLTARRGSAYEILFKAVRLRRV